MKEAMIYVGIILVFLLAGVSTGLVIEERSWQNDCAHSGRHAVSDTRGYTCAPERRP